MRSSKSERSSIGKALGYASLLFALGFVLLAGSACEYYVKDEMDRNKENLAKLRIGMTKAEVKQIMGEPLIKEVYNKPDVWYYYERPRWQDGSATRDECTPVVFDEDGRLAGYGKEYYKTNYEFNTWPSLVPESK